MPDLTINLKTRADSRTGRAVPVNSPRSVTSGSFPSPLLKPGTCITVILLPDYSLAALAAVIEPLHIANGLSPAAGYSWRLTAFGRDQVRASSGVMTCVDERADDLSQPDTVILCGGDRLYPEETSRIGGTLRQWSRRGAKIGAVGSATALLAKSGILAGRRATVHWVFGHALREAYPDITITDGLYEIDGTVFTAGAAEGVCDLVLHLIETGCGRALAGEVANHLSHPILRSGGMRQMSPVSRLTGSRSQALAGILRAMHESIDVPFSETVVPARFGITARQIQRLFKTYLGVPPKAYYRRLRVQQARNLLAHTEMSVTEVAVATGFASSSHFSKVYRNEYGRAPRDEFGPS